MNKEEWIEYMLFNSELNKLLEEYESTKDDYVLIKISMYLKNNNNLNCYEASRLNYISNEILLNIQLIYTKNKTLNKFIMNKMI